MASDPDREPYHEGPDAAQRFDDTMRRVLKVSKAELTKREAAYQKTRLAKKNRRRSAAR